MGDGRDVFHEPAERALIRTADVYQTNLDEGVAGYSDTLLSIVANFTNSGKPEGYNAESMVGKSKRGEVALRLFAVVGEPEDGGEPRFLRAGFKTRGCLAMTACASVICTMIEGKTITPDDVKAAVDGVPYDKAHTTVFAVEGVRGLVGDWYYRSGITLAELNEKLPCDTSSVACLLCEHCSLRDTRLDMMVDEARAKAANA